ncbi:MAG: HAMP domain-containing histidine kinase [Prolixibacteraceae bacterium]|nr:HAMP domain-containing histidine kinase [Prolixibacteraceae bacterium]
MAIKFKNRIALFNTLAVAFTTAFVFLAIYMVVYKTAYAHLDDDISVEKEEVLSNLDWHRDSIIINKMPEWDEAEHSQVEVNPTFLQITNSKGKVIFRSSNLLKEQVLANQSQEPFYDGKINNQKIRLGQFPIINNNGENIGKLTIAVSQEESFNILNNLIWVLLISFPLVLLVQFFASSIAASKAIAPVHQLIQTASRIGDSNISTRLELPSHRDELFELTQTINELLSRIEVSMVQQKQFTSDASHEIRTPLSAIRGTLEVLIRKQREPHVYEEKIAGTIKEVDRLDALLDQLLQLARIDAGIAARNETICLAELVSLSGEKWERQAAEKGINLQITIPEDVLVMGDRLYLELILDNLLNNAIKYGNPQGHIFLNWDKTSRVLSVKDDGIGIPEKDLPYIFNRFYRADESRSSAVKGNGLGLSIVKKLADLQHIVLNVESEPGKGTTFMLQFPS